MSACLIGWAASARNPTVAARSRSVALPACLVRSDAARRGSIVTTSNLLPAAAVAEAAMSHRWG
jgi:hypothetical protein